MIFDLSCPNGESVNDHIPVEYGSLRYESFQEALALVASIGRGAILLKKDLKAAFRHVPLSPYDYWLFFFRWKDDYYVELFLPFGLRTAPFLFNLFAEGLHWVFVYEYGWSLTHYLDDSLSVFPPNTDPKPLSTLYDSVCNDFGIQTEAKKDEMGTRVMHLGFNIDTTIMEASLPPNKRKRAIAIVHSLLLKSWISRTRLEETLGFLSHCCQVRSHRSRFPPKPIQSLPESYSRNLFFSSPLCIPYTRCSPRSSMVAYLSQPLVLFNTHSDHRRPTHISHRYRR